MSTETITAEISDSRRLIPIEEAGSAIVGAKNSARPLSRTTIFRLVQRGEIQRVNIGRRSFITAESVEAYVGRLMNGGN